MFKPLGLALLCFNTIMLEYVFWNIFNYKMILETVGLGARRILTITDTDPLLQKDTDKVIQKIHKLQNWKCSW